MEQELNPLNVNSVITKQKGGLTLKDIFCAFMTSPSSSQAKLRQNAHFVTTLPLINGMYHAMRKNVHFPDLKYYVFFK